MSHHEYWFVSDLQTMYIEEAQSWAERRRRQNHLSERRGAWWYRQGRRLFLQLGGWLVNLGRRFERYGEPTMEGTDRPGRHADLAHRSGNL